MKLRKITALILTVTLIGSVAVFTPAGPTAVAEDVATVRLLPADDTYIDAGSDNDNANKSFEGGTTLEIGYNSANPLPAEIGCEGGETRGDAGRSRDAFLRFDLGEIGRHDHDRKLQKERYWRVGVGLLRGKRRVERR